MLNLVDRVTIFAVGVDKYESSSFDNLFGPEQDIENLFNLLVVNQKTALFSKDKFHSFLNPTKIQLELEINNYIRNISADDEIMLFYFSGHGIPIGRDNFGLCLKDSEILDNDQPLPSTIFKYKDLLNTLETKNVIPFVIIDACYSGTAGKSHAVTPIDAMANLRDSIHGKFGSTYSLLCSCSGDEYTIDTNDGGVFTKHLTNSAKNGLIRMKGDPPLPFITIQKLYKNLNDNILSNHSGVKPRLYLGNTMPEFPFVKNTKYKLKSYQLHQHLVDVLELLWNNGNNIVLSPQEINNHLSTGSYGNHNKLSLKPWNLVSTVPKTRKRVLNSRGIKFMKGNLSVPYSIIENPNSGIYEKVDGTKPVQISNYGRT